VPKDYDALLAEAEALKANIVCMSEDCDIDPESYAATRVAFMRDAELKALVPELVLKCRRLEDTWDPLKSVATGAGSWAKRRSYIASVFAPLITHLEEKLLLARSVPHEEDVADSLSSLDSVEVEDLWRRAIDQSGDEPDHAITLAKSLVESTCKHILDELNVPYEDNEDAPTLYKKVARELNLAPDQHAEQVFKQTLSGAVSIVQGLSGAANKYGDRHGSGRGKRSKPSPRHARLVVNAAGTVAGFLVETWVERQVGKP